MYISRENEKLYLSPYEYNVCRIVTSLAEIVESNGGRVKPVKNALIKNISVKESEFIPVTHTTYIKFLYKDVVYYFQIDRNPFFPFYYSKALVKNGKFSKDTYLEEFSKEWLKDCFFTSDTTSADIRQAALSIFDDLKKANLSKIYRDKQRTRVANIFNDGWHWETVYNPERMEKVDF